MLIRPNIWVECLTDAEPPIVGAGPAGKHGQHGARVAAIRNRIRHLTIRARLGIDEGMPWQSELTIITLRRW